MAAEYRCCSCDDELEAGVRKHTFKSKMENSDKTVREGILDLYPSMYLTPIDLGKTQTK